MKPIYKPSGKAKEYGDYAINIYTGCPHRCYYCFAPRVLHRDRELFRSHVEPRKDIYRETMAQLGREKITGKLIHLCFTCDPYPMGVDSTATRDIIKLLKNTGNHVQILTKNGTDAQRDFDLLDDEDWFGITYAGYPVGTAFQPQKTEPGADTWAHRLAALEVAHGHGIKTWISMEPVLNAPDILNFLELDVGYIDRYKIGKLNYHPSDIEWAAFGRQVERKCQARHLDYYIKDGLREIMDAAQTAERD